MLSKSSFYFKLWQKDFTYSFWSFFQKFIAKCDNNFWKKLSQSVTMIITTCDKNLLQNVTGITKYDKIHCKVWHVLQNLTGITSLTIIRRWDVTVVIIAALRNCVGIFFVFVIFRASEKPIKCISKDELNVSLKIEKE